MGRVARATKVRGGAQNAVFDISLSFPKPALVLDSKPLILRYRHMLRRSVASLIRVERG